jgi:hypothetical protein
VVFSVVDRELVLIGSRNMRICSVSKNSFMKAVRKILKDSFNSAEDGDFVSVKNVIVRVTCTYACRRIS